jgi:hypothetical protein
MAAPIATNPASISLRQNDDFPYKRLDPHMRADIDERFAALRRWRANWVHSNYRINNVPEMRGTRLRFAPTMGPLIMALTGHDYSAQDLISDYFIEDLRVRAIRGEQSAYDYWREHAHSAPQPSLQQRLSTVSASASTSLPPSYADKYNLANLPRHVAREAIWHNIMEVGNFRPTVAVGIVQLVRDVIGRPCDYALDPCAGWGDRLIGFAAAGVSALIDVDPNQDLGPRYAQIEEWLHQQGSPIKRTYFARPFEDIPPGDLINALNALVPIPDGVHLQPSAPFERAQSPRRLFDLVVIDPPYFDLEVYVPHDADGTQSITRYPTFDKWFDHFLMKCASNSARVLHPGGILAIIVNNIRERPSRDSAASSAAAGLHIVRGGSGKEHFMDRMIKHITYNMGMHYLGVVSYAEIDAHGEYRSPQPIWLWEKKN